MNKMQLKSENPKGLHQRYVIRKVVGKKEANFGSEIKLITKPVDKDAEYFVMRLDNNAKDKKHLAACRKAVLCYANEIKEHLPELAKDLVERYPLIEI